MSHPVILADECIGCGICVDACPQGTIEVVDGVCTVVNEESCIACGDCVEECPMGAIEEIIEDQFSFNFYRLFLLFVKSIKNYRLQLVKCYKHGYNRSSVMR